MLPWGSFSALRSFGKLEGRLEVFTSFIHHTNYLTLLLGHYVLSSQIKGMQLERFLKQRNCVLVA